MRLGVVFETILACRPTHDRNAADAVLRAAFVAVGHIDQHIAFTVVEADDLKRLEDEAAPLVEDALAILDFRRSGRSGGTRCWRRWYPRPPSKRPSFLQFLLG
jgi:hypothetical protein